MQLRICHQNANNAGSFPQERPLTVLLDPLLVAAPHQVRKSVEEAADMALTFFRRFDELPRMRSFGWKTGRGRQFLMTSLS